MMNWKRPIDATLYKKGYKMTVKIGDTLYGVHESFFYAGRAAPRKQYKVTQETVTRVFSDGNVRTEYYMDGYRRIGDYMPRDFGKHIFTDKDGAGRAREHVETD